MQLHELPAELRLALWIYAIGGNVFCLITIPWKLTTMPYLDPAALHAWDDMAWQSRYQATFDHAVQPLTPRRRALLKICRQIYLEAI